MTERPRQLPLEPRCRVLVDNDFSGDPDGLVALAHHVLSPSNRVVAVTSSFLNQTMPGPHPTAGDGAALADELLDVIGAGVRPAVHAGSEGPFDRDRSPISAAAEAIVEEARRGDSLPLYLVCGGPLTNVATALRHAPDTAGRLILVWIGASVRPAAFEYNRDTDAAAADFVFAAPGLAIEQFPLEAYRRCAYSAAELEHDLGGSGRVGEWLWHHFTSPPSWVELGGMWPLGDSPPLLITALTDSWTSAEEAAGARHVHTDVDFRLIVGDMIARLRLHETRRAAAGQPD